MNKIVEDVDGFYYWDETAELVGPFNTYQQAEVALSAALRLLAKDHVPELRKMKDDLG